MAYGLLGRRCWHAGYPGRHCALPRADMWLLLRSGEAIRHGADECRHQAMLVLKGNAGTASPHNKPVRSAFPAIGPTDRTPSPTARKAWVLLKLPILDSVSAYQPMRIAECGTRGNLMTDSGLFAPRGQNIPAQGKVRRRKPPSDALGFDHPRRGRANR